MTRLFLLLTLFTGLTFAFCHASSAKQVEMKEEANAEDTVTQSFESLTIYQTKNLIIKKLSNHIYQHISFLNTNDFGNVECNGMIVINEKEAIVFDTPTDNESSLELINFITNELNSKVKAVVPTHFHEDCVGGIEVFEKQNIPTHASNLTVGLLTKSGQNFSNPVIAFDSSLTLNAGSKKVYVQYFGEGHSQDNVIGYFPEDDTVFGGCLIKTVGASKGYLGDANTDKWSETVQSIKLKYPNTKIVIPGHGNPGGTELFDYTIQLFELK